MSVIGFPEKGFCRALRREEVKAGSLEMVRFPIAKLSLSEFVKVGLLIVGAEKKAGVARAPLPR